MRSLFFILTLLFSSLVFAEPSPIGSWQSYDLDNKVRNIVKFSLQNDDLVGTIAKVHSFQGENPLCYLCEGNLHNKPLQGLQIIWGLHRDGDKWINGHVIDIDNGKIYDCELAVSTDNKILHFTGYMGIPTLGATIQWARVPEQIESL